MKHTLSPRLFAVLALMTSFAGAASASPRDELLRLVPEDMTFCGVLQNLRDFTKSDSAFGAALSEMPFIKQQLGTPEFKKLLDIRQKVLSDLEITSEQLRNDLIGDAVVFAYRHGPADKPEQEQGLFLIWARDKALLAKLLERVNAMQKKTGELKELRALDHNGRAYFGRVKAKNPNGPAEFYFIDDHVLAFAPQESMLKAVIDRARRPKKEYDKTLWAKMLDRLGLDKALLSFLVNPRAFDGDLANLEKASQGNQKAFLKEFQRCWQAFEGIGLFANAGADLELGIAVQVRKDALPAAARQLVTEIGKPSALWKTIPDDALFALAARIDFAALADVFAGFCNDDKTKEIRQSLEGSLRPFLPDKVKLRGLLEALGPDCGVWFALPAGDDKTWVPQGILALKLQDSADGRAAETTVRNALQFLTTVAQLSTKEQLRVEAITQDKVEVKALTHGALLNGVRPSFAVKDGYLLVAGSPESIRRFAPNAAASTGGETPILRVSANGWKKYLAEHKTEVAEFLTRHTGSSAKEIIAQIDRVLPNLKSFDRLEISIGSKVDQATVTVRLKTVSK